MDYIPLMAFVKLIGRWNCVKMHAIQGDIGFSGNQSFDLYSCFELWPVSLEMIII